MKLKVINTASSLFFFAAVGLHFGVVQKARNYELAVKWADFSAPAEVHPFEGENLAKSKNKQKRSLASTLANAPQFVVRDGQKKN